MAVIAVRLPIEFVAVACRDIQTHSTLFTSFGVSVGSDLQAGRSFTEYTLTDWPIISCHATSRLKWATIRSADGGVRLYYMITREAEVPSPLEGL
jgi:hypothetical protein